MFIKRKHTVHSHPVAFLSGWSCSEELPIVKTFKISQLMIWGNCPCLKMFSDVSEVNDLFEVFLAVRRLLFKDFDPFRQFCDQFLHFVVTHVFICKLKCKHTQIQTLSSVSILWEFAVWMFVWKKTQRCVYGNLNYGNVCACTCAFSLPQPDMRGPVR